MSYYHRHHLSQQVTLPQKILSKIKASDKILDVGCGNGALKKLLPQNKLYGVDSSLDSTRLAKNSGYFKTYKVNLDKQKLPFNKSNFDLIICRQVLEHLYHPLMAVKEIYRVLRPSGTIFVSVPSNKNKKYDDDYTHVRPFTPHSLETLLRDSQFRSLEFVYQLKGIPGLGVIEKLFNLKVEKEKATIARSIPILRGQANVEIIARKSG